MAELADAHGSGPCDSNVMRVQVSFPALHEEGNTVQVFPFFTIFKEAYRYAVS